MSNVVAMPERGNGRADVAAEVRGHMARRKVRVNHLPAMLGSSQSYWSRRINGEIALDTDDLFALAGLLRVDVTEFFRPDGTVPTDDGPLAQLVEQRTFNPESAPCAIVPLRRHAA